MGNKEVLISGGGIAGSTLAYWLAKRGFRPTLVERAGELRSSGNPIDVTGTAVAVAECMGVMGEIREAATGSTGMSFVNAAGRRVGRINMSAMRRATGSRDVELARADLAGILHRAASTHAEVLFGDSIASLTQSEDGVDATFERATRRRFDLVVGADGLHSKVRRLVFGPESGFVRHLGLYVGTTPVDGPLDHGRDVVMHSAPGRLVTISPTREGALAFFAFRSPELTDLDFRDSEQHKRVLAGAFANGSWRVPELFERVREADDIYFDSVSKVTLDRWSSGRVALVGDAASSVSLFGGGSSLAISGAFTLAKQLARDPENHERAFGRYEAEHRKRVEPKQRNVKLAASLLVPATRSGIIARNLATRLWPIVAVAGSASKAPRSVAAKSRAASTGTYVS